MPELRRLAPFRADPGPSLLHPGRGIAWWSFSTDLAWADGARLWIEREGEILVVPIDRKSVV